MVKNLFKESLKFDAATAASQGARDYQEDSLAASFPLGQETGFAVLADGMGGHLAGNIASALVMCEVFAELKMNETQLDDPSLDIPAMLSKVANAANDRVTRHIAEDPETHGMGSTLLATVITGRDLYWVSIGDSPLLLFRNGTLRQLNKDHSMAPQIDMMVKVGAMPADVGRDHPDRNTLTSAITGEKIDKIDCPDEPTALVAGDIIVASSDGLQFLDNDAIATILRATKSCHSAHIAEALMQAIDDLGDPNQDNTAFTVVKVCDVNDTFETAGIKDNFKSLKTTHVVKTVDINAAPVTVPVDEKEARPPLVAQFAPYQVQRDGEVVPLASAVEPASKTPSDVTPKAPAGKRIVRLVASREDLTEPKVEHTMPKEEVAKAPPEPKQRQAYGYRGQTYYKD